MSVTIPDPVAWAEELLVALVLVILLALATRYRKNLMLFFTGDDVFHISGLECIWQTLTCCGFCAGNWTTSLTMCPCLPRRCRGVNLVRKTGQLLGLTTCPVEIKNIVVGDLPYKGRGDFFLQVECAANPEMATSVAENHAPKVIHFPEVFTLRLRHSPLEMPVRIVVKRVLVVGYEEIAQCHIDAMRVLDWASSYSEDEKLQRLELRPIDNSKNPLTPPWVMLEFDYPTETRDLEHFNSNRQTIRTSKADGTYRDVQISDFKQEYTLVNPEGGPVHEIPESSLGGLERLNDFFGCLGWCFTLLVVVFVTTFLVARSYLWTCWRQMRPLTIAYLHHSTFPVNDYNLTQLIERCDRRIEGTGLPAGSHACLPTDEQVIDFCKPSELGGHFPSAQPRPHAFESLVRHFSNLRVQVIPCDWRACELRPQVAQWDMITFSVVLLAPLALCIFKMISRSCIRGEINRLRTIGLSERKQGTLFRKDREMGTPRTAAWGYSYNKLDSTRILG